MGSQVGLWWAQHKAYADARDGFKFIGWTPVDIVEVRENTHAEDGSGFDVFGMGWDIPTSFNGTRLIRRVEEPPKEVEFPVIE